MMFLSKIAEKTGLFEMIAPSSRTQNEDTNINNTQRDLASHQGSAEKLSPDEELARKIQREEDLRYQKLQTQQKAESDAFKNGMLALKQRVQYLHKSTGNVYDAYIAGVHLDDGPDKPYYTIKYMKFQNKLDEDGIEKEELVGVEKQTDPDRLERVPWNEDATWEILIK